MKIHEYQAAELFRHYGIPVPDGEPAEDLRGAAAAAGRIGFPVVLKAQVLSGGRGRAGGIKTARDARALERNFEALKGMTIRGYPVKKILVSRALTVKREYYLAVTVDAARSDAVILASAEGGMDIEETSRVRPQAVHKLYLKGRRSPDETELKRLAERVFSGGGARTRAQDILRTLCRLFFEEDCLLAEINPLAEDGEGMLWALDAKVDFDDNAAFRHGGRQAARGGDPSGIEEDEARGYGLSFVRMEGGIGCMVNGAGLAMATMDAVTMAGGAPANFLDVGGSSSPEKVVRALELILRDEGVKAVLVNIFGGITRCDDIAEGLVTALASLKPRVPLVVRLTGTNEQEARAVLEKNGISPETSMRAAVEKAICLAQ